MSYRIFSICYVVWIAITKSVLVNDIWSMIVLRFLYRNGFEEMFW